MFVALALMLWLEWDMVMVMMMMPVVVLHALTLITVLRIGCTVSQAGAMCCNMRDRTRHLHAQYLE